MAGLFPPLENINRLKVKPTAGESFLLDFLANNLSEDYEVYFQPFLNGDMPDIIIMRKGAGVVIVEVKDWNLSSYSIDEGNNWRLRTNDCIIKSPIAQAFGYKSNMFNLHINGLAEKNVMNRNFYNILKPFVYFHGSSKYDIDNIYSSAEEIVKENKNNLNSEYKSQMIDDTAYQKKMDCLDRKTRLFSRDKGLSLHEGILKKLLEILKSNHPLFTDDVYKEFIRYLKPPFHVSKQGIDISFSRKQSRLTNSASGYQKVKGVAGSGKTTILAKRAVNAHKRHEDKILILTYNKTLRNYIRDKVSEVREDFSWGVFGIINYHSFITQTLNSCGYPLLPPDDYYQASEYFEALYSDELLFEPCKNDLYKYSTILIDEVQDYKPEWVRIIRKYFLDKDGEMVLFGDDSQNIYGRDISRQNPSLVRGFGAWEKLSRSYRSSINSPLVLMTKEFQQNYLLAKYDIDLVDAEPLTGDLPFDLLFGVEYNNVDDAERIFKAIIQFIKDRSIHDNDVCIVSTNLPILRKIDQSIRITMGHKTETTFEDEETYNELIKKHRNNNGVLDKGRLNRKLDIIRGSKKFSFNLNSGLIKLSTVHSFKGLESHTTIYILTNNDEVEMVYTGITRSKQNFIIFLQRDNAYQQFFGAQLDMKPLKL